MSKELFNELKEKELNQCPYANQNIFSECYIMSNDFLPEDYQPPKGSDGYMKLIKGENKIRILSKPILGWEDWKDKKPIRFRMYEKPLAPVDPAKKIKHFWAFVVWNYTEEKIQILQITQVSIQSDIQLYSKDDDWGSPFDYDLKIRRTGDNMETEYATTPVPKKPLSPEIIQAYKNTPVNLNALFEGLDPFDCKDTPVTDDLPF